MRILACQVLGVLTRFHDGFITSYVQCCPMAQSISLCHTTFTSSAKMSLVTLGHAQACAIGIMLSRKCRSVRRLPRPLSPMQCDVVGAGGRGLHPQQMETSADSWMSGILKHCLLLQCFVVSTLVSMTPANPFIFRNYELSPGSTERARQVCFPFLRAS